MNNNINCPEIPIGAKIFDIKIRKAYFKATDLGIELF
ncbi:MAG: hypothetical protein K0R14_1755 [Burkholderiales bacterium]|jgi:hypothetical protein|nr:hypothetical protein [Burkholderiales bacterium]